MLPLCMQQILSLNREVQYSVFDFILRLVSTSVSWASLSWTTWQRWTKTPHQRVVWARTLETDRWSTQIRHLQRWMKTDDFRSYVFRAYLFSCCPAALFCWCWATSVASERSILWCPAGLGVSLWKRTTSSGCAPSKLPFMKRFAGHADCRCPKLMIVPHATSTRKDRNREEVRKDDSRGLKRWEGLVFHVQGNRYQQQSKPVQVKVATRCLAPWQQVKDGNDMNRLICPTLQSDTIFMLLSRQISHSHVFLRIGSKAVQIAQTILGT